MGENPCGRFRNSQKIAICTKHKIAFRGISCTCIDQHVCLNVEEKQCDYHQLYFVQESYLSVL